MIYMVLQSRVISRVVATLNPVDLAQLLVCYLEVVTTWLDLEMISSTNLPEDVADFARQILLPDATGKDTRAMLGASRKAEIEFLNELSGMIEEHLDKEQSSLKPIPRERVIDYRRRVTTAIDEHWLRIPTPDVRIAMLRTAIQFDRFYARSAAHYYKKLRPHSNHAAELRRRVLDCYLNPRQSRKRRFLVSKYFAPLLYPPKRLLENLRERNNVRLSALESERLTSLNPNESNHYRRTADRMNTGSRLSEVSYLLLNTPSALSGTPGGLIKRIEAKLAAWRRRRGDGRSASGKAPSRILVSRGYGGIGDITMMSGGLRQLAKNGDIVRFGIPQAFQAYAIDYFAEGIEICTVPRLSEIHQYDQIFDFSLCPSWGKEVTPLLKTAIPRHILFAQAMRIPSKSIMEMNPIALRSRLATKPGSKLKISIQLSSDESYRNLPELERLVERVAAIRDIEVIALCTTRNDNLPANVRQTAGMALIDSVREIEDSSLLICPDSAFLHIGEGLGIKTVCLAGPTVSTTLSAYYRHARILRNSDFRDCTPCYRSQNTPCKLVGWTGLYSPCLEGDWFHEHIMDIIIHERDTHTRRETTRPGA